MNIRTLGAAIAVAAVVGVTGAAQAKTLVYCSEGSPEGFNPSLYTSGTTFDASSRTIFNRLVEFERGSTKIRSEERRVGKEGRSRWSPYH